jgi:hypothetical protein
MKGVVLYFYVFERYVLETVLHVMDITMNQIGNARHMDCVVSKVNGINCVT